VPRNPRRAYDSEGREIEPMPLANMREQGVRSVDATCEDCRREATVNVDSLPDETPVPDVALRLRCSACGSKRIVTRPNEVRPASASYQYRLRSRQSALPSDLKPPALTILIHASRSRNVFRAVAAALVADLARPSGRATDHSRSVLERGVD
jgi:hypothetical protein